MIATSPPAMLFRTALKAARSSEREGYPSRSLTAPKPLSRRVWTSSARRSGSISPSPRLSYARSDFGPDPSSEDSGTRCICAMPSHMAMSNTSDFLFQTSDQIFVAGVAVDKFRQMLPVLHEVDASSLPNDEK